MIETIGDYKVTIEPLSSSVPDNLASYRSGEWFGLGQKIPIKERTVTLQAVVDYMGSHTWTEKLPPVNVAQMLSLLNDGVSAAKKYTLSSEIIIASLVVSTKGYLRLVLENNLPGGAAISLGNLGDMPQLQCLNVTDVGIAVTCQKNA